MYITHKAIHKTHPELTIRISKLLQRQQKRNKNNTKTYKKIEQSNFVFQGTPLTHKESCTKKVEENKEK
jgi:hypothetical protein